MPETTDPQPGLPARLEAVLTERFTELGNPFSAMRRHEKGPDGWPASHPVGPHQVAEVLRELLATAPVPPSAPADRAAMERVRAVLETEAVVGRSALDYRGLITSALMADEAQPADGYQLDKEYAIDVDEDGRPFARVLFAFQPSVPGEKRITLVHGITEAVDGARFGTSAVEVPAPSRAGGETQQGEGWQQCPASEFDGYGLQCQKEAGHNLCTFEEPGQADEAQQAETQAGCDCPNEDAVEHQFGGEDCTCIPFVREGGTARYCQPGDTVDQISGWERGGDCPHHRPTAVPQPAKEA